MSRFIAKALFDGYHCGAHLCAPLYKFLLGAPLMAADLMALDRQLALGLEPLLVCLDMCAHLRACTTGLCTSIYAQLWMLVDITQ